MRRTRYFNRDGEECSPQQALPGGVLQHGYSIRVPTLFRDAASRQQFDARAFWDRAKDTLLVGDSRGLGGTEGCKPGFRVADSPINKRAIADAHTAYTNDLENAWRNPPAGFGNRDAAAVEEEDDDGGRKECPSCDGNGYDENGKQCRRCQGSGEIPDDDADEEAEAVSDAKRRRRRPPEDDDDGRPPFGSQDRRTVDEISARHRVNMARIYDSYARELSEAWKGGK